MLNFDPPEGAIVARTTRDHRLYSLQAEWQMFPQSRKLIETDIAWHPEWGIAVSGDKLIAVPPGNPIPQPPSTRRRHPHPSMQRAPQNTALEQGIPARAMDGSFDQKQTP